MFDRYSKLALQVVFLARLSAGERGSHSIDTEDLLYGLFHIDGTLLAQSGVVLTESEILTNTSEERSVSPAISKAQDLPISTDLDESLRRSQQVADQMQCGEIRTEHLLLGLIGQVGSNAVKILAPFEVRLQTWKSSVDSIDCNEPQEAKDWSAVPVDVWK